LPCRLSISSSERRRRRGLSRTSLLTNDPAKDGKVILGARREDSKAIPADEGFYDVWPADRLSEFRETS